MKSIFHPTDLEPGSGVAFLHALRIATAMQAQFTVLHVDGSGDRDWSDLPGVRTTLARWGMIKDAGDMDGLKAIGVGVRKVITESNKPVSSCLQYLEEHPTDLVVLATHQNGGGWTRRKVAEPLSRGAGEPSLFIPAESKGFVDPASGKVSLKRILVPIAMDPSPQRAIDITMRMAEKLADGPLQFTLLHVGTEGTQPMMNTPDHQGWTYERVLREGDPVDVIVNAAEATRADLLVMTTKGHDGFLDVFRGSNTERVLRSVKCPVLAVPA